MQRLDEHKLKRVCVLQTLKSFMSSREMSQLFKKMRPVGFILLSHICFLFRLQTILKGKYYIRRFEIWI